MEECGGFVKRGALAEEDGEEEDFFFVEDKVFGDLVGSEVGVGVEKTRFEVGALGGEVTVEERELGRRGGRQVQGTGNDCELGRKDKFVDAMGSNHSHYPFYMVVFEPSRQGR